LSDRIIPLGWELLYSAQLVEFGHRHLSYMYMSLARYLKLGLIFISKYLMKRKLTAQATIKKALYFKNNFLN